MFFAVNFPEPDHGLETVQNEKRREKQLQMKDVLAKLLEIARCVLNAALALALVLKL